MVSRNSAARVAAGIGDAVAVRRARRPSTPPAISTWCCDLQEIERRLDDRKIQPQAPGQLGAGQLAGEMQRLQRELEEQVEAEARLLGRCRRGRRGGDRSRGSIVVLVMASAHGVAAGYRLSVSSLCLRRMCARLGGGEPGPRLDRFFEGARGG